MRSGRREEVEIILLSAPVGETELDTVRRACYMINVHVLYISTQPVIVQSSGSSPLISLPLLYRTSAVNCKALHTNMRL